MTDAAVTERAHRGRGALRAERGGGGGGGGGGAPRGARQPEAGSSLPESPSRPRAGHLPALEPSRRHGIPVPHGPGSGWSRTPRRGGARTRKETRSVPLEPVRRLQGNTDALRAAIIIRGRQRRKLLGETPGLARSYGILGNVVLRREPEAALLLGLL